jgi:NAD(P)-dependent dehydrogenase (short-subunit alcohol dehydrogenase family)
LQSQVAVHNRRGAPWQSTSIQDLGEGTARMLAGAGALGRLKGLVNCAGIAPAVKTVGKKGAQPLDTFTTVSTVNLIGSFNVIRLDRAIRLAPK